MKTTTLFPATLFATILLASLIACSNEEALLSQIPQEPLTKSQPYRSGENRVKMKRHKITTERAMLIAQEAKGLFADENERIIKTRSITTTLTPIAITNRPKARSASATDTLLFIVNYSNNNGYVFVSNDDRDGEILMYAGGGNFAMQDTAGNPGLKLHVEMMIAYQEHKLNEIKAAEARGEEYTGSMTTETLNDTFAPNDMMPAGVPSGMPGGMPGHTCNITGMPGSAARKDICAPATYVSKDWFGDFDAVELAQNKYRNQKCFGIPTSPPNIGFMTTGGGSGFLGEGANVPTCVSTPYCAPPLWNYKEYYIYYGCRMNMLYRKVVKEAKAEVLPLLKTYWDQHEPLHYGEPAGCGPTALIQLMAYHMFPKTYYNEAFGRYLDTNLEQLRTFPYNTDLIKVPFYANQAHVLCNEIGDRLNVMYFNNGSAVPGLAFGAEILRKTLRSFGYSAYDSDTWDYQGDYNFVTVVNSITNKLPVLIYGFPEGKLGVIKLGDGHIWLLDGYKHLQSRYYYADYYFDEYGKFNAENRYVDVCNHEYVHGNMGWGEQSETDYWVLRGVYQFGSTDYCNKIYFIANIKPVK